MKATLEPPANRVFASSLGQSDRAAAHEQLQLVTFEVGDEEYAVNILAVQEINRMLAITRVPQSPPCVEGVINLRGRIIPVVDLRKRFGLEPRAHAADTRIVVAEVHGRVLGFTVDRVHEVLRIDRSIVEPAPAMATSANSDYIEGVGKLDDRLLILLDLPRLFDQHLVEPLDAGPEAEVDPTSTSESTVGARRPAQPRSN